MPARPLSRSTAGRIMVGIAIAGVVVAAIATVVAWRLVGEVDRTLDETLAVTSESLTTIEDTIALADVVVADVAGGLDDLDAALANLEQGIAQAGPVLDDVAQLSSDVPAALTEFKRTLDGVAGAAAEVDRVLAQLDAIPLAPDISPQTSLSARLRDLSADLDPVIGTLRGSSTDLSRLAATTDALRTDVSALADDVSDLNASLADSSRLVGDYRAQASRAGELAAASRQDLAGNAGWMRALIVMGGLLLAVSQFVPLWVGLELIEGSSPAPPAAGHVE